LRFEPRPQRHRQRRLFADQFRRGCQRALEPALFQRHGRPTIGDGEVSFDRDTGITQVPSFVGEFTTVTTWHITMSGIEVSYAENASFIPYAGTVSISGLGIRPMTVTFDSNSPSTGIVMVSVEGGPPFPADIDEL
jgi:hypothetical protein